MQAEPLLWVIAVEGRLVGSVRLYTVDHTDKRAALAIGFEDSSRLGQGLGSEAIKLVLKYAFDTMKLHRISPRVIAYDSRAIRAYEKCGFVREGVEREAACVGGVWHVDVMMAALPATSLLGHEPALKNSPEPAQSRHLGA